MPQQDRIQKGVNKSRREWQKYTNAQEKRLYAMFNDAANRVEARINAYTREGKIIPTRLVGLLGKSVNPQPESIRGIIRSLRPPVTSNITSGVQQSVNLGMKAQIAGLGGIKSVRSLMIGSSFIGKDGKIRMYDVRKETWGESKWGRINKRATDFLVRTQYGGDTLSNRVWDLTHESEVLIRNRINTGVILGESAADVARDCKQYLREPTRRFRRIRKDGKLVLSAPAKAFKPGRGVYRNAYNNAMRVARTEMNRAYHEGTVRYGLEKTWIKGWISRVGSGNPAEYDASVNGQFFPKGSPPNIPYHPNCMCHAELVLDETPDSELDPAPSQADFEKGKKKPSLAKAGDDRPTNTISP